MFLFTSTPHFSFLFYSGLEIKQNILHKFSFGHDIFLIFLIWIIAQYLYSLHLFITMHQFIPVRYYSVREHGQNLWCSYINSFAANRTAILRELQYRKAHRYPWNQGLHLLVGSWQYHWPESSSPQQPHC